MKAKDPEEAAMWVEKIQSANEQNAELRSSPSA